VGTLKKDDVRASERKTDKPLGRGVKPLRDARRGSRPTNLDSFSNIPFTPFTVRDEEAMERISALSLNRIKAGCTATQPTYRY
jgi:hypothetical protein